MKNIQRSWVAGVLLAMTALTACDKFDDINTNPNTTTQVSASLLCTNVVLQVTKFSGSDGKALVAENALPKYVGYANEGQMDQQYNKIGNGSFSMMTVLPNIDAMLEYATGSVMEDSYKGVASFARAFMFYKLTMEMGDIPYSEADQAADGLYRPAYDTQEDIFKAILDELEKADQYFAAGETFSGDPTPYNGDPEKWRRATNAFELKVLMSLSGKVDDATLDIKNRFAAIVDEGYLLESGTGFFGLQYSSQNKHPLSGTSDIFTSRTIPSSLLVDDLKNLDDRRLFYLADPCAAQTAAGKSATDPDAYVGVDVSIRYDTMSARLLRNVYSLINSRYLNEVATEPRRLLTYAEQELILAEARIRGWITTGTAQNYYEQGVRAALTDMMSVTSSYAHGMAIDQSYIDGYFTGEAAFQSAAQDQLEQIWMQRYILNFMQDAETSYFEYRRTGYPVFPINPATSLNANNTSAVPMRWLYPSSETNYNRDNLIDALDRQYDGYDEINKLMWLLK